MQLLKTKRGFRLSALSAYICMVWQSNAAFGQGGGAVLPLSAVMTSSSDEISFTVYNYSPNDLDFQIDAACDIDGTESTGDNCYKHFKLNFDVEFSNGVVRVPKGGRANGLVSLMNSENLKFALFKPIIDPLYPQELGKNSVAFKINYQPGYLFLLKPADERLSKVLFNTTINADQRRGNFEFDLSGLKLPQEVNVSAKFMDKNSGKLIRFVPLVKNKIVDPRRGKLQVSGDFSGAENKSPVCAQIFIQSRTSNSSYRLEACEE